MTPEREKALDASPHDRLRASVRVPVETIYGRFTVQAFEESSGHTHIALWCGDVTGVYIAPLVRLQSSCITSTALKVALCDCAAQLTLAFERIATEHQGVIVYLDQEGRGHGLFEKVITMAAMANGATTVTAFTNRGLLADLRSFAVAATILDALDVGRTVRLLTNNPDKIKAVIDSGRTVERLPLWTEPTEATRRYLECKRAELGHLE